MSEKHIYMDHGASTPVRQEVVEAMLPYWTNQYGNPASSHYFGREASQGLERSRRQIADLLNARPDEIVFTGCGSESDNLALRGVMLAARESGRGNHLIVSAIEHNAILDTGKQLRDHFNFDLTILPVDSMGKISLDELEQSIRPDTVLISIMAANNEIGTFQPFEAIGQIAHDHHVLFHSDAVQAAAYVAWDMEKQPIDLMSIAPHKFYGPKGVGILFVRQNVEMISSLTGGGQEDGRRAGTVNVPFAVGAAESFRLALSEREKNISHHETLRDRLIDGILDSMGGDVVLTGHPTDRLPHNASFAVRGVSGNDLLIHLDVAGICGSSGSACKTGNPKPSAILEAIGLEDGWTRGGLRFTVGRQNTMDDVEYVLAKLPGIVETVKSFSMMFA
jgi:cysteine desulfurase